MDVGDLQADLNSLGLESTSHLEKATVSVWLVWQRQVGVRSPESSLPLTRIAWSTGAFEVSFSNHSMTVIEADGMSSPMVH